MLISKYLKSQTNDSLMFRDDELRLDKCPCCGAEAKLQIIALLDAPCHYSVAYIKCTKCRIRTENRRVDRYYGDTSTVNDVIDDWNNRPLRKE